MSSMDEEVARENQKKGKEVERDEKDGQLLLSFGFGVIEVILCYYQAPPIFKSMKCAMRSMCRAQCLFKGQTPQIKNSAREFSFYLPSSVKSRLITVLKV